MCQQERACTARFCQLQLFFRDRKGEGDLGHPIWGLGYGSEVYQRSRLSGGTRATQVVCHLLFGW